MCDWAYHHEALRKQRVIQRKLEANARLEAKQSNERQFTGKQASQDHGNPDVNFEYQKSTEPNSKVSLDKYRVNEDGFKNRYRQREKFAPHVDHIYPVMYPGSDNSDYTNDPNRTNRRQNVNTSKYDARKRVNGEFDMKVLTAMQEIELL